MKTVYRLLQKDEKGLPVPDTPWCAPGCPALLSNEEVNVIIERLKQDNGMIYGKADVEHLLVSAAREKVIQRGGDPDQANIRFSATSVRNYITIFKSKLSSSYWDEPSPKKGGM